ncbi:2-amino-4-hydroxy-6-hydroxymethyldihydropteridine diphosphokinase [Actinotalea sp. K2]|uniref:2-amino-4-hydroxy-6- hydroxymethyldihydropteridine diphosphokinase n=1 Tax=Actinotalea sp. K2 TaxID=2939438 RepID=UPI0020181E46|nr:2-amino-4-hydroxy-6-hydroxymethyldihydropteridine diphosphokinase [Actinotalea sp. K2]MCL3861453.1 2-amino-4-hydroxy-6-hydroxymethyldihydropteridine diphosphokinase [Actinotalea sp. K2]
MGDARDGSDGRVRTTGTEGSHRDRVRLTGISATGHHGVFEHERRDGQTFVADVVLHVDTRPAAAQDRLDLTVHYGVLAEQVAGVLSGEPADLIETVAERIAAVVLTHRAVEAVEVVLHKPQAPITVPFQDVTVEIRRDRTHLPVVDAPGVVVGTDRSPEWSEEGQERPDAQDRSLVAYPPLSDEQGPAVATGAPAAAGLVAPPLTVPALEPMPGATMALADLLMAPGTITLPPVTGSGERPTSPQGPAAPAHAESRAEAPAPRDRMDVAPAEPVDVVLALGSNLGPSQEILREAVLELAAVPGLEVTAVSPLARTAPVGGPDQPDFLNAVVLGRTTLAPRALMHVCQEVEQLHGREREVHWGARTLDIDVVVHGSTVASADDLELPHPRAHQRAFVLQPWAHVDPQAVLPGLGGGPVAALAGTAPDREGIRWMALDWWQAPEAGA